MNCDKCQHSGICMFEAGARQYETAVNEIESPAFIDIRVGCQKFRFKYADKAKKKTDKKEVNA